MATFAKFAVVVGGSLGVLFAIGLFGKAVDKTATAAQAQMLQPVPMTAEQTEFYNFAVVATYATNCGPDKGDYLMGQAINSRLNQYGMAYMPLIEASAATAKAFADGIGMEKFCAAGASDAGIQQGVAYLQSIVKIMKASRH